MTGGETHFQCPTAGPVRGRPERQDFPAEEGAPLEGGAVRAGQLPADPGEGLRMRSHRDAVANRGGRHRADVVPVVVGHQHPAEA